MGEYRTWYPSGTSWQSIFTLEGPSMVTAKAPEPTLVLLMMKSDSIPVQNIVTIFKPCGINVLIFYLSELRFYCPQSKKLLLSYLQL